MEALEGGTAAIPGAGDLGPPHRSLAEWVSYIDLMAASGINWLRLYCAGPRPWATPLGSGWAVGLFGGSDDFWSALRAVVDHAAQRGVMVEYCLFDRCDPQMRWADHPFNRANGGPLDQWEHFFDLRERESIAHQRRYLRTAMARLGDAPNLFFDLCNELTPATPTTRAWAAGMARCLRAELGWRGPLGISTPCHARADDLCLLPGFDLCLPHGGELHAPESYWEPARLHAAVLAARLAFAPRPVLVDEVAHRITRRNFWQVDYRRERAAFWAAITAGGMTVRSCWQPFAPTPTLRATAALRRLLDALPWAEMVPADELIVTPAGHGWALATQPAAGPPTTLLYLPHAGLRRLTLALPAGNYLASWSDPADGRPRGDWLLRAEAGRLTLQVPSTRADLALVLRPEAGER